MVFHSISISALALHLDLELLLDWDRTDRIGISGDDLSQSWTTVLRPLTWRWWMLWISPGSHEYSWIIGSFWISSKKYIYIYQNGAASRDFTRILPGTMVINHQELEYVFLRKTLCRAGDWQMFYYNISNWWYTYPLKIWKSDWLIIPTIGENKGHIPNHQPDITIYLLVVEWGPCQTNLSTNGPQPDIERDQISTVIAIKERFFNLYQLASNGILMWSNDIIQDILWR
jgi:hypothetical protein